MSDQDDDRTSLVRHPDLALITATSNALAKRGLALTAANGSARRRVNVVISYDDDSFPSCITAVEEAFSRRVEVVAAEAYCLEDFEDYEHGNDPVDLFVVQLPNILILRDVHASSETRIRMGLSFIARLKAKRQTPILVVSNSALEEPSFPEMVLRAGADAFLWRFSPDLMSDSIKSLLVSHSTQRVLVVDEEASVRDLLSKTLALADYDVDTACDSKTALDRLYAVKFDLLIVDLQIPDPDGIALIRQARRTKPNMPIIMSRATNEITMGEAEELGVEAFIFKPFRVHQVLAAVLEAVHLPRVN